MDLKQQLMEVTEQGLNVTFEPNYTRARYKEQKDGAVIKVYSFTKSGERVHIQFVITEEAWRMEAEGAPFTCHALQKGREAVIAKLKEMEDEG